MILYERIGRDFYKAYLSSREEDYFFYFRVEAEVKRKEGEGVYYVEIFNKDWARFGVGFLGLTDEGEVKVYGFEVEERISTVRSIVRAYAMEKGYNAIYNDGNEVGEWQFCECYLGEFLCFDTCYLFLRDCKFGLVRRCDECNDGGCNLRSIFCYKVEIKGKEKVIEVVKRWIKEVSAIGLRNEKAGCMCLGEGIMSCCGSYGRKRYRESGLNVYEEHKDRFDIGECRLVFWWEHFNDFLKKFETVKSLKKDETE